ncbi:MAG: 4Fe-4S dicluster domain-containing protein [Myxococcales bacterium]|nr:4Fe-4S dicluster domain-containing protein [Myxococcales bacterium]
MDLSQASRPLMWNVSVSWPMYAMFVVACLLFGYGAWRRIASWRKGKASNERLSDFGKRFWILIKELLFQTRVRNSSLPGWFHSFIFYSFIFLVITTAVVALDVDFGTTFFRGYVYVFFTVGAELAGLLILVGISIAAIRRYVVKPKTLENTSADGWPLLLIGFMVLTGFLTEGLRIAVIGDPYRWLSPIGTAASFLFAGISPEAGAVTHQVLWWTHTVAGMAWIALIPYTKFVHMLALPTNVFFSKLKPRGELARVDIEALMEKADAEDFNVGVAAVKDFTWKQRLDFDACISCGRCDDICPAVMAGHPFSPKRFIHASRDLTHAIDGNGQPVQAKPAEAGAEGAEAAAGADGKDLVVGNAVDEKFIWYCRTCMACMEVCPAAIDHVDSMMEVRRNELMIQGRVPTEASRALKSLETSGNPFGPRSYRSEWVAKNRIPVIPEGGDVDVLFWIGCCTTYDETKQKIATDLLTLLDRSGISYGVLGEDETCCGDPARVVGDERLFQEIAKKQVAVLNQRKFRVLLVNCPHCYNVLKNEYPQFGGNFRVAHHSEFLHEMLWSGVLRPSRARAMRIAYHDPCYLGRYQKIYQSPREVLRAIPGAKVLEMGNHHERSMCCGGGGGHYWMDLKPAAGGERINNLRVDQLEKSGADTLVTACPYCLQMLNDSLKLRNLDEKIRAIDLASLVLESVEPEAKPRT